jgi:hypothetical protein
MSNKTALLNPEILEQIRFREEEKRRILHNNLMQRILKLRDKIGTNISLTEVAQKLDDLEMNIKGGCDLEEVEEEIIVIEKVVSRHFQNPFYAIRHQGQIIVAKAKGILKRQEIEAKIENKTEKSE